MRTMLGCLIALLTVCSNTPVRAQTSDKTIADGVSKALDRLGVALPLGRGREAVLQALDVIAREPCDRLAIGSLANAFESAGHRRDAASALVRFSETCGGDARSLRRATNIYLTISDWPQAKKSATSLIALEPLNDNGYFLRAVASDNEGTPHHAIDDYITAIELFANKDRISDVSYLGLARSYDRISQPCDSAAAIEAWVAANPVRNDTTRARNLIAEYGRKGNCVNRTTGTEDAFPISGRSGVVTLPVIVNGVRGVFILDTGATFVSIRKSFADKAKVVSDGGSTIRLHTANGFADGKRARASTIQLRTVQAQDVAVVVQTDEKGTYGNNVDGLLGMSFLSRFHVTIDRQTVRIRARSAGETAARAR